MISTFWFFPDHLLFIFRLKISDQLFSQQFSYLMPDTFFCPINKHWDCQLESLITASLVICFIYYVLLSSMNPFFSKLSFLSFYLSAILIHFLILIFLIIFFQHCLWMVNQSLNLPCNYSFCIAFKIWKWHQEKSDYFFTFHFIRKFLEYRIKINQRKVWIWNGLVHINILV